MIEGYRCAVLIREKTKFNALLLRDGTYKPAISRYRVEITANKRHGLDCEQSVESEALQRDRNHFNKALIRAFIKNSCTREAWNGAPWLVKEQYARKFRIDMTVPEHLRKKEVVKPVEKEDKRFKKKVLSFLRAWLMKAPENDIKYPIDDLDDRLTFDAAARPRLKQEESIDNEVLVEVMSTWTFLNVFGEPLRLDSFTLDDYIDALKYQEIDFPSELIIEIHCALLRALVSAEAESLVIFPRTHKSKRKQIDSSTNTTSSTPSVKAESVDISMDDASDADRESSSASSVSSEYNTLLKLRATNTKPGNSSWTDWRVRIQQRDFNAGGWEFAIVGILDELADSHRLTPVIIEILTSLLPPHEKHTRKTVKDNYARLPPKLKIRTIHLLTQLVCQTPTVREHIEDCMTTMTELRKDKVDAQRERKTRIEELTALEVELQPFTPEESMNGQDEDTDATETDHSAPQKRSIKMSLKRKREEEEERIANIKRTKEYQKRLKLVDQKKDEIKGCEERIVQFDNELREKDCQRLRLLGKDRFYNRYWYLEGNGLSGVMRGEATYGSARLWVQGPSVEDAAAYLGAAGLEMDEIPFFRLGLINEAVFVDDTMLRDRVVSRKEREEGQSILYDENSWGFYDDSDGVEGLIAWLNPKGIREAKLRTALLARKEGMYEAMEARKKVYQISFSGKSLTIVFGTGLSTSRSTTIYEKYYGTCTRTSLFEMA